MSFSILMNLFNFGKGLHVGWVLAIQWFWSKFIDLRFETFLPFPQISLLRNSINQKIKIFYVPQKLEFVNLEKNQGSKKHIQHSFKNFWEPRVRAFSILQCANVIFHTACGSKCESFWIMKNKKRNTSKLTGVTEDNYIPVTAPVVLNTAKTYCPFCPG